MTRPTDRTAEARVERVRASLAWLDRYRPLVDDLRAFRAALDEPPPVDLLVLPARRGAADLVLGLAARGIAARTFPDAPWHIRVENQTGAGTLPEVLLGFALPQGVASAFGPQALAPRPGELVLDMAAAPGGKTVLLDALAGGGAALLAGEPSGGRAGILVQLLARCGVASTLVVQQDGRGFPAAAPFDALLLDAPCSGEGTFRVPSPRYDVRGEGALVRMPTLQSSLLARALDLLAPGGRLLYSTCAYSPEENEAVVDTALGARDDVRVLELPPGTPGVPGTLSWGGRTFRPELERARRILPHHLGSWGFFLALLGKDRASERVARPRRSPVRAPEHLHDDAVSRSESAGFLHAEFGVEPDTLDDVLFARRGRDDFVVSGRAAAFDVAKLHLVTRGLRLLHRAGRGLQPTNAGLRWLGGRVRRNVIDLTMDQAATALAEGSAAVPGEPDRAVAAVRVDGVLAAKGHVTAGRLGFDIPAGWR